MDRRNAEQAIRTLRYSDAAIDFCSNDYLGMVHNHRIENYLSELSGGHSFSHGSTGSRLLAGNYRLIAEAEEEIAAFHESEAAILFNSGYDANIGLLSAVPQKNDHILYDALAHASIRDGVRLSFAQHYSFGHNDPEDLERKLKLPCSGERFVVTESVFSMDGDVPPFESLVLLCEKYGAHLIVDEAHGIGIAGKKGEGVVQAGDWHRQCFARVYTFGKAPGCHGAAIAGSSLLKSFLVNFSRPFIYTTALPEASVAAIRASYALFPGMQAERAQLQQLIGYWKTLNLPLEKLVSDSPVQGVVIPGNHAAKQAEYALREAGIDARAILSPTVPAGSERLRLVLHAYNTNAQLEELYKVLIGLKH